MYLLPAGKGLTVIADGSIPARLNLPEGAKAIEPYGDAFKGLGAAESTGPFLILISTRRSEASIRKMLSKAGLQMLSSHIAMPSFQNPRWLLPNDRELLRNSCGMVKPTSLKAKTAWRITRALNAAGRPELVFPDRVVVAARAGAENYPGGLSQILSKVLSVDNLELFIYTGTNGYFQKFTVQVTSRGRGTIGFAKISQTPQARKRIEDESNALKELGAMELACMKVPRCLFFGPLEGTMDSVLVQSSPPSDFSEMARILDERHVDALSELFLKTKRQVKGIDIISRFGSCLEKLTGRREAQDPLVKAVQSGLDRLRPALEGKEFYYGLSHGDFTPWNLYLNGPALFAFDWELAAMRGAMCDMYNFILHSETLIANSGAKRIFAEMKDGKYSDLVRLFEKDSGTGAGSSRAYLPLYLIEALLYYIDLASKHEQAGLGTDTEGAKVAGTASELLHLALADMSNA